MDSEIPYVIDSRTFSFANNHFYTSVCVLCTRIPQVRAAARTFKCRFHNPQRNICVIHVDIKERGLLSLSLYLLYQENKFNRLYGEERSSRGTIARSSMLRTYHVFRQVKGVRPSRRMRHYNPVRLIFMLGPHHQSVGFSLDNPIIVLHPIRFELGTLCPCSRQSRAKHFSFLKTLFNTART